MSGPPLEWLDEWLRFGTRGGQGISELVSGLLAHGGSSRSGLDPSSREVDLEHDCVAPERDDPRL
jgi:hypothetical protein